MNHRIGEAQLVVLYGFIVALLMPNLVSGTLWAEIPGSRQFALVGHRSYSMYRIELIGAQATMGIFPQIHFGPLHANLLLYVAHGRRLSASFHREADDKNRPYFSQLEAAAAAFVCLERGH
ncbi:hypothetical protein [Caballeronia udeis]|uniref:hypothetical protein n=1 Tax=Caballeronia udeis TaxID=1232866 RepID=UPI0007C79BB2|nr:hypothetical protein [Caballeronia udeis]